MKLFQEAFYFSGSDTVLDGKNKEEQSIQWGTTFIVLDILNLSLNFLLVDNHNESFLARNIQPIGKILLNYNHKNQSFYYSILHKDSWINCSISIQQV